MLQIYFVWQSGKEERGRKDPSRHRWTHVLPGNRIICLNSLLAVPFIHKDFDFYHYTVVVAPKARSKCRSDRSEALSFTKCPSTILRETRNAFWSVKKNWKKLRNLEVLAVLFWGLKASEVWTSFMSKMQIFDFFPKRLDPDSESMNPDPKH
jgi:hypothetical protein